MTEVNNGTQPRLLLFTLFFLGKVNVLTYLGYGGMHDKMLTYNLCGLDVPLNDRFSWFGGWVGDFSGTMKRSVYVSSLVE